MGFVSTFMAKEEKVRDLRERRREKRGERREDAKYERQGKSIEGKHRVA